MSYYFPDVSESWKLFFILVFGILAASLAVTGAFSIVGVSVVEYSGGDIDEDVSMLASSLTLLFSYVIGFIPALAYVQSKGRQAMEKESGKKNPQTDVRIHAPNFGKLNPALFVIVSILGFCGLVLALDALPSPTSELPHWIESAFDTQMSSLWVSVLMSGICAPVLEEFFCRGIILRGLLKTMQPLYAVLWSSVFFAILHLNPWQAFPAFFCGLFLGWLYYRTRNYWMVVALHAINNISTLLVYHFTGSDVSDSFGSIINNGAIYVPMVVVAVILLIMSVIVIQKMIPSKNGYEQGNLSV